MIEWNETYRDALEYRDCNGITIAGDSINVVFRELVQRAVTWPEEERRGGEKMLDSPCPVTAVITKPWQRVLTIPGRNNNFPAVCAETLWVLAGRNDIEFLEFYLPRAKDFSDDGKIWRAGYGPRLRKYSEGIIERQNETVSFEDHLLPIDQLDFVVQELKNNPASRRAVMTFLDPPADSHYPITTKDFPCTQSLSFMVRNGKLDLTVFIRSNDLFWGFSGVNVYEFTTLQCLVANMIGLPVGKYYHVSNNLHVYGRHRKMADEILSSPAYDIYDYFPAFSRTGILPTTVRDLDAMLGLFFDVERSIRTDNKDRHNIIKELPSFLNRVPDFVENMMLVVLAHCAAKSIASPEWITYANMIYDLPMKISFLDHTIRTTKSDAVKQRATEMVLDQFSGRKYLSPLIRI